MILGFGNTTVADSGIVSTTTQFAPIFTFDPMQRLGNILAPAPNNTLSPIIILPCAIVTC